jgi:hypothetical protein
VYADDGFVLVVSKQSIREIGRMERQEGERTGMFLVVAGQEQSCSFSDADNEWRLDSQLERVNKK